MDMTRLHVGIADISALKSRILQYFKLVRCLRFETKASRQVDSFSCKTKQQRSCLYVD